MAEAVYLLGILLSFACALLLARGYRRTRVRLLLWSFLCFVVLTINNALLFVDLIVVPDSVDLSLARGLTALVALALLLYGLIWEAPA